jgi:hyperosmotically inducible periplasmic protein
MKSIKRLVSAALLLIGSFAIACQSIPPKPAIESFEEKTRAESSKDAVISKGVKERLLSDKNGDLTRINVHTKDGAVDLTGTVASLDARERAVKLAWQVTGVQSVVNHLVVE